MRTEVGLVEARSLSLRARQSEQFPCAIIDIEAEGRHPESPSPTTREFEERPPGSTPLAFRVSRFTRSNASLAT